MTVRVFAEDGYQGGVVAPDRMVFEKFAPVEPLSRGRLR